MHKWISIPQTVVTCIAMSMGIAKSGANPGDDYLKSLKDNIQQVIITIIYIFVGFLWINYIIIFAKNENEKLLKNKIILQEEVGSVMDNLDEIILSKS